MKPLEDCRLYTFLDFGYLQGRAPEVILEQLCEGGSDLVQLRAKGLPPDEVRRLAEPLLVRAHQLGVGLVINDHWSVALAIGAPYCHLGQEDFFDAGYTQVSQRVPSPSTLRLGLSSHAPEQARRAVEAGAAYLGVGPVYATPTKPSAPAVTLDYVRWAADNLDLPWFAIGGINLDNLDRVLAAGARRICVVSAILQAPSIVQACQAFKRRLGSA